jgi:hypothetical protein
MKKIIFYLLILTLFGCASTKKQIKERYDPLIGSNINSIITSWGAPTKVYNIPNGGGNIYTWIYRGPEVLNAYQYGNYGTAVASQSYCQIDWITNVNNTIVSYRTEGRCRVGKK